MTTTDGVATGLLLNGSLRRIFARTALCATILSSEPFEFEDSFFLKDFD